MSEGFHTTITLADSDATAALGRKFAACLAPGDCLLLEGGIGAGKTHFARALIQARLAAAGRMEDVPSPTYTLVQTYDDSTVEIWHADLYRLTNADEVMELGLDEAFANAITLIEWPDRLGDITPENSLLFSFMPKDDGRILRMSSRDPEWEARLNLAETRYV